MVERQFQTNMLLVLYDIYYFLAHIALKLARFNAHGEVGTNSVELCSSHVLCAYIFVCVYIYIYIYIYTHTK